MNQFLIYYPVFTLIILTFVVLGIMFKRRVALLKNKEVSMKHFRTYSTSEAIPEFALQASRNYTNLHETPLIFYIVCAFAFVTNKVGALTLILAWAYTLSRILHTYIHIYANNIQHRYKVFGFSWLTLIALATAIIF